MSRWGRADYEKFRKLQQNIAKLAEATDMEDFCRECCKALAARLLALVIPATPVGKYPKAAGKKGGTLRRGWTGSQRASAQAYADSLAVSHSGGSYVIEITNPVEYAPYVEYGHRTANHKGWVRGLFMLTISEQEIQESAPRILEKKIRKFLGDVFG